MRVYLAGPDVFLPDPQSRALLLKQICARHGVTGVSPLDAPDHEPPEWAALPLALRIARRNEAHIASSQALIANLTPFRGPSADAGTVFELGFMRALGRPVFGWTNTRALFLERTLAAYPARADRAGALRDADDMMLEDFGMHENLMIDGAIIAAGGRLIARDIAPEARWRDLSAFEECVEAAARSLFG